jgi:hypothetical protein
MVKKDKFWGDWGQRRYHLFLHHVIRGTKRFLRKFVILLLVTWRRSIAAKAVTFGLIQK